MHKKLHGLPPRQKNGLRGAECQRKLDCSHRSWRMTFARWLTTTCICRRPLRAADKQVVFGAES